MLAPRVTFSAHEKEPSLFVQGVEGMVSNQKLNPSNLSRCSCHPQPRLD
jgi:hypothetical protein